MDLFEYERECHTRGFANIAGIDEAGRGPLAGPVVAAACIIKNVDALPQGITDSKKLTPKKREQLFTELTQLPSLIYSVGIIEPKEIDEINILQATFEAMKIAVKTLELEPDYLLVDGNRLPTFDQPAEAIVKGDSKSLSIASASILAKVTRDRIMQSLHMKFPSYGFDRHMGYGTKAHLEAIEEHGPTDFHRRSFAPLK